MNWQNTNNSHCFLHKNTLPVSYIQWWWREQETRVGRVKRPCFSFQCIRIFGGSHTPWIQVKMGVCSTKWFLGDKRLGAPCCDSDKGWCIIRINWARLFGESFEPGLVIQLSPWPSAFLCTMWFSFCSTMWVHKKSGDAVAFHNVVNNFVWGATFEN